MIFEFLVSCRAAPDWRLRPAVTDSDTKVTKPKPPTLAHFADFCPRLPSRADIALSWRVDLDARKHAAAEQARPPRGQLRKKEQQAAHRKERLAEIKKPSPKQRDEREIARAHEQIKSLTKEACALAAKTGDIENAGYDLKAVNPNKNPVVGTRTPQASFDVIEAKGREIDHALAELRLSL